MAQARPSTSEIDLVQLARGGDENAFRELVENYRGELHAHCYRMLGSVHDAEDALQDALLRAWLGLAGFEGRSSVRSWLYSIVTNTAIDLARRRSRRELPADHGPAGGRAGRLEPALMDPIWLEPYPDRGPFAGGGPSAGLAPSAEARYEQRESLEIAFVVALQHLPPMQRAVLILREVVGFSAQELADQLGTSVPAVNSALQRARAAAQNRLPAQSQQVTLRTLGDARIRALAERYADAIERADTDLLISMLTEDATWSMPPIPTWFQGVAAVRDFLDNAVMPQRWRHLPAWANGQLAVGCYMFDPDRGRFLPGALDVLTLRGDRIAAVTGFLTVTEQRPGDAFARFGLPAELS